MLPRHPLAAPRPPAGGRLAAALALLLAAAPVFAAGGRMPIDPAQPHLAKATGRLVRAQALALAEKSPEEISEAISGLPMRDGRIDVEITFSSLAPGQAVALSGLGLEVRSTHPTYNKVYGRLDPARLARITALPEVLVVRPTPQPRRRVGAATSQGDLAMETDQARMELPYDGTGVVVGILSDSYRSGGSNGGSTSGPPCDCDLFGNTCARVATGMANQASGDLPPSVPILDDCTAGSPNCDFLIDEGAALGEHVMDVAPGSGQLFHSAFNGPADFAEGITELVNCGADVVVDDVFYTGQPFFQDGDIALAAQNAVDLGVPYFSAAGNDATFGIHDVFMDANDPTDNFASLPNGDDFHLFAPGDPYAAITLPNGCEIVAELQWSEPFAGAGPPPVGALSDLDLYILSSPVPPSTVSGANILNDLFFQEGVNPQGCGAGTPPAGNPIEIVDHTNLTGGPQTVYLAVEHFCGDETVDLRIVNLSFNCSVLSGWNFEDGGAGENPIFVDSQIFGHPAARGAVAVGAAFFGEITGLPNFPPGNSNPPNGQLDVEAFSSLGGDLPFFFDGLGAPAPETRFKPEIVGPDGGNTTFFGSDIFGTGVDEPDTDPNFFGTSAAAPHAAGLAALILDLNPNITPKAITELMKSSAMDIETVGPDNLSGFGFLDGLSALRSLDPALPPLASDLEIDLDGASFLDPPNPSSLQRLEAIDTLTLGDGDFDGVFGMADSVIFTDGFESGDVSSWSSSPP